MYIYIKDSLEGNENLPSQSIKSWNADINNEGTVKCYLKDNDTLYIVGNGSGKIFIEGSAVRMFSYEDPKLGGGAVRTPCDFNKLSYIFGLDLLDTSACTSMYGMFANLEQLNLYNCFSNTSNVTNMDYMFYRISQLPESLAAFDVKNVLSMCYMCQGAGGITTLDLRNWDNQLALSNGNTTCAFYTKGISNLILGPNFKFDSNDQSTFIYTDVRDKTQVWYNSQTMQPYTGEELASLNRTEVITFVNDFPSILPRSVLESSKLSIKRKDFELISRELTSLTVLSTGVTGMNDEEYDDGISISSDGHVSLWVKGSDGYIATTLDNVRIRLPADCSQLFRYMFNVSTIKGMENLDSSKVTNMQKMFYGNSSLKELDLSNFNTANTTDMSSMFEGCSNLKTIYVSDGWSTENLTTGDYSMFLDCPSLVGAVPYDSTKTDTSMANYTTGYLTYKAHN